MVEYSADMAAPIKLTHLRPVIVSSDWLGPVELHSAELVGTAGRSLAGFMPSRVSLGLGLGLGGLKDPG